MNEGHHVLASTSVTCQPGIAVEVVDALSRCAPWFRAYYNSYQIPLRYWPSLWGWFESIQHQSPSTGPGWLYRRGAQAALSLHRDFDPDVVVATEVGLCELASMHKRQKQGEVSTCGFRVDGF